MLVYGFDNNGLVYVFTENYKNGSMHSRWCVVGKPKQSHKDFQMMVANGMDQQEALELFNERTGK